MKKLAKSKIFSIAWFEAKQAAKAFGGTAREYFSECLRSVYASIKKASTFSGRVLMQWVNPIEQTKVVLNSYDEVSGEVYQTLHYQDRQGNKVLIEQDTCKDSNSALECFSKLLGKIRSEYSKCCIKLVSHLS